MSSVITKYNVLEKDGLEALAASEPERFQYRPEGGAYLNLKGAALPALPEIDEKKIAELCRIVRGLFFAAVDGAKSGHPGGSSSKTEMLITLLASGVLGFDALVPKHPGRDRVVWSAGHCSPLAHAVVALVYEALRKKGVTLPTEAQGRNGLSRRTRGFPHVRRPQRARRIALRVGRHVHGFFRARNLRGAGFRGSASFLRTGHARLRDRRRRRDRRGDDIRNAQCRFHSRHPEPRRHAGLQSAGHRRSNLRRHAVALPQPLVRTGLEHHRGRRAQHPGTRLRVPAGGSGFRSAGTHGDHLPCPQRKALRQTGGHLGFSRHAAAPPGVRRSHEEARFRHPRQGGRRGGRHPRGGCRPSTRRRTTTWWKGCKPPPRESHRSRS